MRKGSLGVVPGRRCASLLFRVSLVALAGAPIAAAAAAPVDPQARALYADGLQRYRAGAYEEAIAKLEASYHLVRAPGLLYDLAQAYRMKGDCASARDLYRDFLGHAKPGAVEALARAHLVEMESCAAQRGATSERSVAVAPTAAPLALAALSARPLPSRVGADAVASSIAPRPAPSVRRRRAAWTAGAVCAGLATVTGYLAWKANQSSDQVSGLFKPGQVWNAAGMDAEQSGHTSQRLEVFTGVGAILTGGIALWLAGRN